MGPHAHAWGRTDTVLPAVRVRSTTTGRRFPSPTDTVLPTVRVQSASPPTAASLRPDLLLERAHAQRFGCEAGRAVIGDGRAGLGEVRHAVVH